MESIKGGVEELLAHMEVAAERDMEAIKEGRPAFLKFKMLKEVSKTPSIPLKEKTAAMAALKGLLAHMELGCRSGHGSHQGRVACFPGVQDAQGGELQCPGWTANLVGRGQNILPAGSNSWQNAFLFVT